MLLRRVTVLVAALALSPGCSGDSPSRFGLPSAPTADAGTPPAPATHRTTLTIRDGWTEAPVGGAQVVLNDVDYVTDAAGQVEVRLPCTSATITAAGYLERRLTCRLDTFPLRSPALTLWPVANDAEREATQSAAFPNNRLSFGQPTYLEVDFDDDLPNIDGVNATWANAARRISELTSGRVVVPIGTLGSDEGFIVAEARNPPGCTHSWFTWSFAVSGFCWDQTSGYFILRLTVASVLLQRDDVALRALLYGWGLRPHPLPGLMNETRPSSVLSDFELKTIHMASLRGTAPVGWPDTEQ
jgi:hypothetical protein